ATNKLIKRPGLSYVPNSPHRGQGLTRYLSFYPGQRRTMPRIGSPPHPARFRWQLRAWDLAIVAELPADFSFRQKLPRSTADPLRRIPQAVTLTARQPRFEIVERTNAPTTQGAPQPHPLTHDAAACPNQRYNDGAASDQFQIERGRPASLVARADKVIEYAWPVPISGGAADNLESMPVHARLLDKCWT